MRIERLQLKGISSAFPNLVDLALGAIEPGVVAVVGANGEGKTIILEATPAAIYRKLPARNNANVVDYATGRDSFVALEYVVDDGTRYRSRVNLDGQTRKSDALLQRLDPAAGPLDLENINNGQATTYDAAIRDRFPSFDLFLNSSFAAQGRGDEFTRATPSKRKDLFAEFLALRRLLGLAQTASAASAACVQARGRLQVRLEQLDRALTPEADQALDAWALDLDRIAVADVRESQQLTDQIAALEARERLAGDAVAAFAAAQLQVRTYQTELEARRAEWRIADLGAHRERDEAPVELRRLERQRDEALQDVDNRIAGNRQIQDRAPSIRAAVEKLRTLEEMLAALAADADDNQRARDAAYLEQAAAKAALVALAKPQQELERARTDVGILATVPCGGLEQFAGCQFLVSATAAAGRIGELEAALEGLAAAGSRLASADQVVEGLAAERARIQTARQTASLERTRQQQDAQYDKPLAESDARLLELAQQRTAIVESAALVLDAARTRQAARLAELTERAGSLQADVDRLAKALQGAEDGLAAAAAGNRQALDLQTELGTARAAWDALSRRQGEADSSRAEIARRRAQLVAGRLERDVWRARLAQVERDLLDWQFLAKALGKGGLPDLEIDAAGPSISALTNDLLGATYGPRFTLELVTQVEKADGSGMRDEFTVRVLDNDDAGDWRDVSDLSGGERVIVQEALMLAICLYVNERSPMPIRTLWRDETGAALDPVNAVHYLNMLRRARTLGGFAHVFFVSHNPEIVARADAQIQVAGGEARIVLAPFGAAA